jgi:hypothetical protein
VVGQTVGQPIGQTVGQTIGMTRSNGPRLDPDRGGML